MSSGLTSRETQITLYNVVGVVKKDFELFEQLQNLTPPSI
jgi:hypothetical protein